MPSAFISYVRENQSHVDRLVSDLKRHGVRVWLDRQKIKPGQRWADAIRQAIIDGDFFLACFSREYSEKHRSFMNEELTVAVEELRLRPHTSSWFVPIKLNECEIPLRSIGAGQTIQDLQWANLATDWDDGLNRLLSAIRPNDDSVELPRRMIYRFLHDLAVPLVAARAVARELNEENIDPGRRNQYLDDQGKWIDLALQDIRAFSSTITLATPAPTLYKSATDITAELHRVVKSLSIHDVDFELRGFEVIPGRVDVDAKLISQLLAALCDNAARYSRRQQDERAVIVIDASRSSPDALIVRFENEGPAITTDEVESVFEFGVRGRRAAEINVRGLGNGLFVARRIADLHGGSLMLVNRANPVVFELRLPIPTSPNHG